MKQHEITILFTPGSDFQEELHLGLLENFLKNWADFIMARHKKNDVKVEFRVKEK